MKYYIIPFIFLFVCFTYINAQEIKIEGLKRDYNQFNTGSALSKYEKNSFAEFIERNSSKIPDTLLSGFHLALGDAFYADFNFTKALYHNLKAREFYDKLNDIDGTLAADLNIGNVQQTLGNNFDGLKRAKNYIRSYSHLPYSSHVVIAKMNAGIAFSYMSMFDSAQTYFFDVKKNYPKQVDNVDSNLIVNNFIYTANMYALQRKYGEAIYNLKNIINTVQVQNNPFNFQMVHLDIASNFAKSRHPDSALKYYNIFLKKTPKPYSKYIEAYNANTFGDINRALLNFSKAISNYKTALNFFSEIETINEKLQVLQKIGETYLLAGNNTMASVFFSNYRTLSDSVNRSVAEFAIKGYELERKKEINDNIVRLLNLKNKQQLYLLALIILLLLAAFIIAFSIHLHQQNKSKIDVLNLNAALDEKKLNELKVKLQSQLEERRRIAADIHDSLGASIVSARLNMEQLLIDRKDDELIEIKNSLVQIQQEARSISHNLMPPDFESENFINSMQKFCSSFQNSKNYTFEFNHGDPTIINQLDVNMKGEIFKMIQELTANAVKHSNATQISLSLSSSANATIIIIEDNGDGFDVEQAEYGLGLNNCSNRCKNLGGAMSIDSRVGRGTSIQLQIPNIL